MTPPRLLVLTLLPLLLANGAVSAADNDKTKKAGSYQSGGRPIGVTRFDPPGDGPHPAILLLHGADGAEKNEATYTTLAARTAGSGYVVFVVRYFDCFADRPKELAFFRDNVKDHLQAADSPERERLRRAYNDCLTAIGDGVKYARKQTGVDGDKIGIVGFSLGAYLALSTATQDELKIVAVVDLFGGLPEELHKQAKKLPPVFIVHGEEDRVVPVEAAKRLEKLLKENSTPHEVRIYKGVGHVFEDEKGKVRWDTALDAEKRAAAFLEKHLKAK
jgi:carboxymethylenebutenolidase